MNRIDRAPPPPPRTLRDEPKGRAHVGPLPSTPKTTGDALPADLPELPEVEVGAHPKKAAVKHGAGASITGARILQRAPKTSELFREVDLGALTSGRPFSVALAGALERIAGAPITQEALSELYRSCLPDTRVRVSAFAPEPAGTFEYTVTWIDNTSEPIATVRRKLKRHDDGSLELYSHGCWVDHAHRGRGLSARVMQEEVALLRTLSDHPSTRLSLWAGGAANPRKRSEQESVGIYTWAAYGFDFACRHGLKTKLGANTDRPRVEGDQDERRQLSDLELMRAQLAAYVDRLDAEGVLGPRAPAPGPRARGVVEQLRAAAASLEHPHTFAALSVEGVRLEAGQSTRRCSAELGKAFLLSREAPRWEGVFFVHDREAPGAKLAAAHLSRAVGEANRSRKAREAASIAELRSKDPEVRARAIERIGIELGPEWIGRLTALAQRRPEHTEAVETAILRLKHEWQPPRPAITYTTTWSHGPARFEVPREYAELEALDAPALVERVRGPDFRGAAAALLVLSEKLGETDPGLVRAEAKGMFERLGDEERWMQRRTVVDVLGRLPAEAGVPELSELWRSEEDINVLIAFQRWLDAAESPAAERPAAELGARVEVMKREIEEALAAL